MILSGRRPAVLLGLISAAVLLWHWRYPAYTHRLPLTLEVKVAGEVRTGTGVIEVTWQQQPAPLTDMSPWKPLLRGEAVPVSLGRHGVLLAVLGGVGTRDLTGVTVL